METRTQATLPLMTCRLPMESVQVHKLCRLSLFEFYFIYLFILLHVLSSYVCVISVILHPKYDNRTTLVKRALWLVNLASIICL